MNMNNIMINFFSFLNTLTYEHYYFTYKFCKTIKIKFTLAVFFFLNKRSLYFILLIDTLLSLKGLSSSRNLLKTFVGLSMNLL